MINLICAVTKNYCIGNNGDLVIKDKQDLNLFKKLTWGKTIVMGRKTWESLPKQLPNRIHIVLSNSKQESGGDIFITDFETFRTNYDPNLEYWVIGGGEIYRKFLEENLVDSIYLSTFEEEIEGDTFFPAEELKNFQLKSEENFNNFKLQVWTR